MITIKAFEFNYFQENTFVLYDSTREAVIIDCGCLRPSEEKELSGFIAENNLMVKHLLCTHLHLDHIFGNPFVFHTYGLSPRASKLDEELLPSAQEQARAFGLSRDCPTIPIQEPLTEGDVIGFGDSELKVMSIPGHSPESLAFYNKEDSFAMVGDALFAGSIGRTDLWGGNHEALVTAIHSKLLTLPDETVLYPGHGPKTRVIDEKLNNPYL